MTVQVVPEPRAQTADGLLGLAADVDSELWWGMALQWLDVQVDQAAALDGLLAGLERAADPALLLLALAAAPDQAVGRLTHAMQRLAVGGDSPRADLSVLALEWLHRHDRLPTNEIEDDVLAAARVVALSRLAVRAPELVVEALTGEPTRDLYAFVQLVGQVVPPHAVELLEVIGNQYPDKAVAKAARKQLFRTRSRLVQQRSGGASS